MFIQSRIFGNHPCIYQTSLLLTIHKTSIRNRYRLSKILLYLCIIIRCTFFSTILSALNPSDSLILNHRNFIDWIRADVGSHFKKKDSFLMPNSLLKDEIVFQNCNLAPVDSNWKLCTFHKSVYTGLYSEISLGAGIWARWEVETTFKPSEAGLHVLFLANAAGVPTQCSYEIFIKSADIP